MNAAGTVIQTYDFQGLDLWFALNLAPDGTSFYSGDFGGGDIYRFDIASGTVLDSQNTGTGGSTLFGLAVAGEITVGGLPSGVPEPSTYAAGIFLAAMTGCGWYRRRQKGC